MSLICVKIWLTGITRGVNFTARGFLSSLHLFPSTFWRSARSLFRPLQSSSFFFFFSLGFSTPSIVANASSTFIYFYTFKSISAIVLEGFLAKETMNSLNFNPALKVFSCTASSTLSTSNVSQVKCITYNLRLSFSPCLMVSKWSAGLFGHYSPMK